MKYLSFLFIIGLFISGCSSPESQKSQLVIRADTFSGTLIADTIIYDVIIKNPNPEDLWTNDCLKKLSYSMLMDSLFYLVYTKQAVAYDYFSKEPLSIKDVKRLENEEKSGRSDIGKIQFTEKWYFNSTTQQFQKEVISVVLGAELLNEEGIVRGYKPAFQIQLNH